MTVQTKRHIKVIQFMLRRYPFDVGRGVMMRRIPSRWSNDLIIGDTAFGFRMELNLKDRLQWEIFSTGVWEKLETNIIKKYLREGQVFYDIGANIGYFSLLASQIVKETGCVYSFDASFENVDKLKRNVSLNNVRNVEIMPYGLWNCSKDLTLYHAPLECAQSTLLYRNNYRETYNVRVYSLDERFHDDRLRKPDFIKIDVEGAEFHVIKGMTNLLSSLNNVVLMVEITAGYIEELGGSECELKKILYECGFSKSRIIDFMRYEVNGESFFQTNELFIK